MDKTGEDWDGLHLGKFKKRWPTFFQVYVSLYQNIFYIAGKSFSIVMWPWDLAPLTTLNSIFTLKKVILGISRISIFQADSSIIIVNTTDIVKCLIPKHGVKLIVRMIFSQEGDASVTVNGETKSLSKDDVILIPSGSK